MSQGVKHDKGKRQWWYLQGVSNEVGEVIDVLEYGDTKYPANDGCNWKRVENPGKRYTSALFRHIMAWMQGEKYDPETGKHHLAHAITNCLFLMWFENNSNSKQT